jgi:hypothetical protein
MEEIYSAVMIGTISSHPRNANHLLRYHKHDKVLRGQGAYMIAQVLLRGSIGPTRRVIKLFGYDTT